MKEKVVVITGASSGIGASLAEVLAKRGHRPVLFARRPDALAEVAARCGESAFVVTGDVTKRADLRALVAKTIEKHGRIDAWVNNAGRGITRPVSELTDEDFDDMMLVNTKSVLWAMQEVLPHFKERKHGHIVNVSSMLGRLPLFHPRSAYSAAKAALNLLTAALRQELATDFPNVHVSTVSPGIVATDFGKNARHGGVDSRAAPRAQPVEEVADVIADVLEKPVADVYTFPGAREMVARYYAAEDMGAAERAMGPAVPSASRP